MFARRFALFSLAAPVGLALVVSTASAQNASSMPDYKFSTDAPKAAVRKTSTGAKTAAAPKAERRPGELEGGFNSGVTAPLTKKKPRPADVVSEKALPDGGLPLPETRERGYGDTPMGFDKNGNMGTNLKF